VVETPDSIFVSDMEHSREVKSIVSHLKQEGRSEYHQHRTGIFPWGNRTLLEEQNHFKAARLVLNPSACIEIDSTRQASHHLLVLCGSAKVTANQQSQILKFGQSVTLSGQTNIGIENVTDQRLTLMHIQIVTHKNA
jgi:mannose-6-phosphate isomerase-like protein (cupin superfamily)